MPVMRHPCPVADDGSDENRESLGVTGNPRLTLNTAGDALAAPNHFLRSGGVLPCTKVEPAVISISRVILLI